MSERGRLIVVVLEAFLTHKEYVCHNSFFVG